MKENELNINEIFDTGKGIKEVKNPIKKSSNKSTKKEKIIIIVLLILAFILISLLIIRLLINKEPETKENLIYSEFEPLISKLDDDTYYIFGAKKNISFDVEKKDNFDYQVLDEDNKEITTEITNNGNIVKINAPVESYDLGKTYTLKINNGTFTDDKLRSAKKIVFNIARPAANDYKFNEGVKVVSDIKIENNKLSAKEVYKENDIIAVETDGKITNIYKIIKENEDGTYEVNNPKIDDVFTSIDYYGMEKLNLSSFVTDKELNPYLVNAISNTLINYFARTVYAKENIEIKKPTWDKKTNELKFSVIIEAPENSKILDNNLLKEHKTNMELYVSVSANLYKDVSLDHYDYALALNYTINNKVNLTSINKQIVELNDNIRNSKKDYDATWLTSDYSKINNDKISINKTLGNNIIYTEIPGLNISFDFGFIANSDVKTILDGNVSGKIKTTMGVNSNKDVYGSFLSSVQGTGTMIGDSNVDLGYISKSKISFLDTVTLESNINPILHIESKSEISEKEEKENKEITYEVKGITIFKTIYNLNAVIDDKKIDKKIYDNKEELKEYQNKMEFTKKIEKKEKEYKYTKEEVRQKLKVAYDELDASEEWTLSGGSINTEFKGKKTIDIDNNKMIGTYTYDGNITYTCNYDYLNKSMNCNNFETAKEYIKNVCDSFHDDYLNYIETGESDNEIAEEWENLYDSLESCYYEMITKEEPKDYKEEFNKILNLAKLTEEDLEVLKG